jgi:hypothetical protein
MFKCLSNTTPIKELKYRGTHYQTQPSEAKASEPEAKDASEGRNSVAGRSSNELLPVARAKFWASWQPACGQTRLNQGSKDEWSVATEAQ